MLKNWKSFPGRKHIFSNYKFQTSTLYNPSTIFQDPSRFMGNTQFIPFYNWNKVSFTRTYNDKSNSDKLNNHNKIISIEVLGCDSTNKNISSVSTSVEDYDMIEARLYRSFKEHDITLPNKATT